MVLDKNKIPLALRIAVIFCYLSDFSGFGFFAPMFLYFFFPRHFFVRYHALAAMLLHLAAQALTLPLRISSHLFVIELETNFLTIDDFLGGLFSADQSFTGTLIVFSSMAFLFSHVFLKALGQPKSLRRMNHDTPTQSSWGTLIIVLCVPLFFYTEGLWTASNSINPNGFMSLNLPLFQDPYKLIPGHFILLWCMFFSVAAFRGKVIRISPISKVFVYLELSTRRRGLKRYQASKIRALLFPGWGDLYDRKWISGFATASCFLLGLLFFWISTGLVYASLVEDVRFLNANFPWYFLGKLGLRSHVLNDKQFADFFGSWPVCLFLFFYLIVCYLYSWLAVRYRYLKNGFKRYSRLSFLQMISFGFILHLMPLGILLLIPITVSPLPMIAQALNEQKQKELEEKSEPIMVIPDHYDQTNKTENDDSQKDGQDGKSESLAMHQKDREADLGHTKDSQSESSQAMQKNNQDRSKTREQKLDTTTADSKDGRLGERKKKNYSTYLSIRIRNIEKDLQYWNRQPKPYSAVFEYRISGTGRVYNVRILEGSGHPNADQKTVALIEAMDPVLPPPRDESILVRELFWNTEPADKNLPTETKRKLSTLFDGRSIEKMGH